MRLSLSSDFEDYYDCAFSEDGLPFVRVSQSIRTRSQVLLSLEHVGMRVPRYGSVQKVVRAMCREWMQPEPTGEYPGEMEQEHLRHLFSVVVLEASPDAPTRETKHLLSAADALKSYPDSYCVEYINPPKPGVSWRYLQVGKRRWWLELESHSEWRSEHGDHTVTILSEDRPLYHPHFSLPLFAIDFIPGRHLYAINFHTAPRIEGTGLEHVLAPEEVVELLTDAKSHFDARDMRSHFEPTKIM